ncbi:MAG: amino acid permease [candidate division KSB1 bacterium]|nr:amino acid permease [candidate division KSB1 bacterium]MDZ7365888.1 amino acid permease [candidate division KSB1 bacterium]MDZ7403877.1 amino acid permease [candidate division KSB1 bacterium]
MPQADASSALRRDLTLLDSTMINVGTMIASAIFIVPATIAMHAQGSALTIIVWVVGGVVSLMGALAIAELGAAMPEAGGQFVYLREAYGPAWGFLYGWGAFMVINTASIAAIAVAFAQYLGYFFPLSNIEIKLVAMLSTVALTTINCFGLKLGAWTQNVFTFLKMAALAGIIVLSFVLKGGAAENFTPLFPAQSFSSLLGPLGLAMVAALWAYDGWIEITYVGSEVKNPQRNLPLSIIFSMAIVIALYVLISIACVYVLSVGTMAQAKLVAAEAATKMIGPQGAAFVTIAILISTLGSNNGIVFTAARIPYAMAKEGLFFQCMAKVNEKYRVPLTALIVQGVWACILTASGTYDQLFTYVVFVSWLFYAMSCGAVIMLRRKAPNLPRPYKTWGYPFVPIIFILFAIWLVINTIMEAPHDAAIGAGIMLSGLPVYFYWKRNVK